MYIYLKKKQGKNFVNKSKFGNKNLFFFLH